MDLFIGIIIFIIGAVKYLAEPTYPTIGDFNKYIEDNIKYGNEETDKKWLNGKYGGKFKNWGVYKWKLLQRIDGRKSIRNIKMYWD